MERGVYYSKKSTLTRLRGSSGVSSIDSAPLYTRDWKDWAGGPVLSRHRSVKIGALGERGPVNKGGQRSSAVESNPAWNLHQVPALALISLG